MLLLSRLVEVACDAEKNKIIPLVIHFNTDYKVSDAFARLLIAPSQMISFFSMT